MSSQEPLARATAPPAAIEREQCAVRRPFDPRVFDRLPKPTRQGPPYRAWWVVEEVEPFG